MELEYVLVFAFVAIVMFLVEAIIKASGRSDIRKAATNEDRRAAGHKRDKRLIILRVVAFFVLIASEAVTVYLVTQAREKERQTSQRLEHLEGGSGNAPTKQQPAGPQ